MKTFYFLFFSVLLTLSACKKESGNCDTPTMQFTLEDKKVNAEVFPGGAPAASYELEYGPEGFTKGSGTTSSFTGLTSSFTVTAYGRYDIYLRKNCGSSNSDWLKQTINVDGSTTGCQAPGSLDFYTSSFPPRFEWYGWSGNFFDVEYGPTGFTIGNGTRLRTNAEFITEAILHAGITYDFYVRSNCGGNAFSTWSGPRSIYASQDVNISIPCTVPTNLYAYKINWQEINYSAVGHGSISYEIAFSISGSVNTGNILTESSPNGTVGSPSGFNGTYYFWVRGKCDNGSFTAWAVSQVQ